MGVRRGACEPVWGWGASAMNRSRGTLVVLCERAIGSLSFGWRQCRSRETKQGDTRQPPRSEFGQFSGQARQSKISVVALTTENPCVWCLPAGSCVWLGRFLSGEDNMGRTLSARNCTHDGGGAVLPGQRGAEADPGRFLDRRIDSLRGIYADVPSLIPLFRFVVFTLHQSAAPARSPPRAPRASLLSACLYPP